MIIPSKPTFGDEGAIEIMPSIKAVIDYSGMNYEQVLDLPIDTFQIMLKNYIVEKLKQTDEGRQYLADCERLQASEPDMIAVRKAISKQK